MRCNPRHQSATQCYLLIKGLSLNEKKRIEKKFIRYLKENLNIDFVVHLRDKIPAEIMNGPNIYKFALKNGQFEFIKDKPKS